MKKNKKSKGFSFLFYKELFLAGLALLSVYFVFYEFIGNPSENTLHSIQLFELAVASIFLFDFFYYFAKAKSKKTYMQQNWYMLLASIPILDSWAELLRGLRMLEFVRLIRAGEHLQYALKSAKQK